MAARRGLMTRSRATVTSPARADAIPRAGYPRPVATITDELVAEHRVLTEGCGLVDRSERGKLALTGGEAKSFLAGQVTNDIVGLEAGSGCYAAFLTHKGKMLGDLRVLAAERRAAARHRARDAAGAVRHGAPLQDRLRRRAAQAHGAARAAVAHRAAGTRGRGRRGPPGRREHAHRAGEIAGHAVRAHRHGHRRRRPLRRRRHRRRARRAGRRRARRRSPRTRPRSCASSAGARATASSSTTRRSRRRRASTSAR